MTRKPMLMSHACCAQKDTSVLIKQRCRSVDRWICTARSEASLHFKSPKDISQSTKLGLPTHELRSKNAMSVTIAMEEEK
eukprot:scaffold8164_cov156-Skeletonema_menzelii.AAC.13